MNPVLFEFGDTVIYSYPAMLFLAWFVALIWVTIEASGIGVARRFIIESVLFMALFSLLGARLAYLLFNMHIVAGQPIWKIFDVRESGLFFLGGLVTAIIWMVLYCRYRRLSFFKIADFYSPFLSLGYAITRWGCFLNGCCYGIETGTDWGFIFQRVDFVPRHPTQLYASLAAILIFFILRRIRNYRIYTGFVFFSYLVLYGIYRFIIEFYRVSTSACGFLTEAQIAAIVIILTGVALHLYMVKTGYN